MMMMNNLMHQNAVKQIAVSFQFMATVQQCHLITSLARMTTLVVVVGRCTASVIDRGHQLVSSYWGTLLGKHMPQVDA